MLSIKVTRNLRSLNITGNSKFQLVSVAGLNPPVADIAYSQLATSDGGVFNIARGQARNIVLTIQPMGGVEAKRLELYEFLAPKSAITLDVKTDSRDVTIDGYVESMEIDYNANPQLVQVSIICPNPYFKAKTKTTVSVPGTVINPSEVVQGAEFTLTLTGSGAAITISNLATNETLTINGTFASGQVIKIDTRTGQKMVKRNGNNIMSLVDLSSDWITLQPGNNAITISGVSCTAVCEFYPLYMGV